MSVSRYLKTPGYVNYSDVWVLHDLTKKCMCRVSICNSLPKHIRNDPFLKITDHSQWKMDCLQHCRAKNGPGVGKWKAGLHLKKVMMYILYDRKGIIYYEFLLQNETLKSDRYSHQLDRLQAAISEKRPELTNRKSVVIPQDIILNFTSLASPTEIVGTVGWVGVIPYCTYYTHLTLYYRMNTHFHPY